MPPMDGVSTPFEARHRALLEAIPDLLLRLRADGAYLEVAGDLSRLANPPETVPGANVRDLLDPDIADQLLAGVRQALATGELATVNYTLRTYGGEQCDFELRIAPAGPDEVVVIARDVTDVRVAIRELQESEALANAAKHAAACLITVRVAFEDGLLVTEVADDGCGGADENGSGLQGLADRVASIGGRLAVSSIPGAGTALRAEIPS